MFASLSHRIESIALRRAPEASARALGVVPPSALEALQRARFRRTLRRAADRSPFYREAFRQRGIDVTAIDHPSQLGDFYTTGEDLRTYGPDAFTIGRATTAFETTGTTSPFPKRVLFSQHELDAIGCASAAALRVLGLRRDDIDQTTTEVRILLRDPLTGGRDRGSGWVLTSMGMAPGFLRGHDSAR